MAQLVARLFSSCHFASVLGMVLGLLVCYLVGTLWYMFVWAGTGEPTGFIAATTVCVLPYILPDLCKLALALAVSRAVRRHISV